MDGVTVGLRKIRLTIDSNLDDVSLVGIAVNRFATYAGVSEMDAFNIELCVTEAVTNCIKHAYGEQSGREVSVIFTLSKDEVVFEICDSGEPMDAEKLSHAALVPHRNKDERIDTLSESGRGLGIISEIMDDVSYGSEHGCNCLRVKKKLP